MKTITVPTHNRREIEIAYKIFESPVVNATPHCVFASLSSDEEGLSVLEADNIIRMICNAESMLASEMRFYDLVTQYRTRKGILARDYRYFTFDEVNVEDFHQSGVGIAKSWQSTRCPKPVLQAFAKFLPGKPPLQDVIPTTADAPF